MYRSISLHKEPEADKIGALLLSESRMKVMWAYLLIVQGYTWQWLRSIQWSFILKTLGISAIIVALSLSATFVFMVMFERIVSLSNSILLTGASLILLINIGLRFISVIEKKIQAVKSKNIPYKEFRNDF